MNDGHKLDMPAMIGSPGLIELSVIDRLRRDKRNLEGRLQQVNEALEALEENPEVMDILEKLSKVTHF